MNKQATVLENAAKRSEQTNFDSSTMRDSHRYSITWHYNPTQACSKNGTPVTTGKWGWKGEKEGATLARENFREEPSLGGYVCAK